MKIEVNNTVLFFDVDGEKYTPDGDVMREKPTLILLHGGPGGDHTAFKPIFSELTDAVQLIYIDLRGCGRSKRDVAGMDQLAVLAQDIYAFCQALSIVQPVILGQSFGGFIALKFAAMYPKTIGKLVLSSTTVKPNLERACQMFRQLGGEAAEQAARRYWLAPSSDHWDQYKALCLPLYQCKPIDEQMAQRAEPFNVDLCVQFSKHIQQFDISDLPAQVRCPTLILAGEKDPITTMQDAIEMHGLFGPNIAKLARFADAAHGVYKDQPQKCFDCLRQFIRD